MRSEVFVMFNCNLCFGKKVSSSQQEARLRAFQFPQSLFFQVFMFAIELFNLLMVKGARDDEDDACSRRETLSKSIIFP